MWSGSIQIIPINSIASTALLSKEPIHLTFLPPYEAAKEIKYKMLKYFQNKYFSSVTALCVQFPIFYLNWQADNLCCQIFRFFCQALTHGDVWNISSVKDTSHSAGIWFPVPVQSQELEGLFQLSASYGQLSFFNSIYVGQVYQAFPLPLTSCEKYNLSHYPTCFSLR